MARPSVIESLDTQVESNMKTVERTLHEQKISETRNEFNERIDAIADKVIEFRERGAEEYLIDMLTTFLDVALDMRDIMDALEATSQGMQCIATAVGFIDEMLDFNMGMFETSLEHNYGFFERAKQARRIRKAIRNNTGRMKMVVKNMTGQYKFATKLVQEMKGATASLRKSTKKGRKGEPAVGKAESYLAARLQARGEGGSAGGASAQATPPPASGVDTGIDDIV